MALVSCPECGGSVSDAAASCPACGHPMGRAALQAPLGVAASALPFAAAPGAEVVLWQGTPSLRMLLADTLKTVLFAVAVIVGVVLSYDPLGRFVGGLSPGAADGATYASGFRLAVVLFVVTVVGLRVARLAWRAVSLRHHRYRVSNQRLSVETGIIAKNLIEIDMRTVDDITFNQGVVERLLKLGQIDIISSEPAGASGRNTRLRLVGVSSPRAVRETIRDAVYKATHGQLFTRST